MTDNETTKMFAFLAAVIKNIPDDLGKQIEFKCPICNWKAKCRCSELGRFIHASCEGCLTEINFYHNENKEEHSKDV